MLSPPNEITKEVKGSVKKPLVFANKIQPLVHSISPAQKARAFSLSPKIKVKNALKGANKLKSFTIFEKT